MAADETLLNKYDATQQTASEGDNAWTYDATNRIAMVLILRSCSWTCAVCTQVLGQCTKSMLPARHAPLLLNPDTLMVHMA